MTGDKQRLYPVTRQLFPVTLLMASMQPQLTAGERALRDVFTRLAAATDEFEGYKHPHAERLVKLADELARFFGLGRADRGSLRLAALGHDLGEAAMKRDYIARQGPLTDEERFDLMRHPVIGEQEAARAGADRGAQLLVRWSHEWWNGLGYPDALRREQIPLAARILRVADAYAALTDARPFRGALTEAEAHKHLIEWAGIEFDPQVVRAFLTLRDPPELRSYALLERAYNIEPERIGVTEATTDNPDDGAAALIGSVPEPGLNPHLIGVQSADASTQTDAPTEATSDAATEMSTDSNVAR
jgi:HD-GYP domain-containing protein (c-di-GMP phosphodiesterase class II)